MVKENAGEPIKNAFAGALNGKFSDEFLYLSGESRLV
jgi:hypothetical protein